MLQLTNLGIQENKQTNKNVWINVKTNTVEPLLKDPPKKGQCINYYLSTRDIL